MARKEAANSGHIIGRKFRVVVRLAAMHAALRFILLGRYPPEVIGSIIITNEIDVIAFMTDGARPMESRANEAMHILFPVSTKAHAVITMGMPARLQNSASLRVADAAEAADLVSGVRDWSPIFHSQNGSGVSDASGSYRRPRSAKALSGAFRRAHSVRAQSRL